MNELYDVIIIGGGPAGLAAGLTLGRACRRVILCNAGPRRNERAAAIQNYLTQDGVQPNAFRSTSLEQLRRYPNVELLDARVESIMSEGEELCVDAGGRALRTRRVLLCTGVVDLPLGIKGSEELWGNGIFQCPYCHGWEHRGQRWGLLGSNTDVVEFALILQQWTPQLTVFTQGLFTLSTEHADRLRERDVALETQPIEEILGDSDSGAARVQAVLLIDGRRIACDALFAHPKQAPVELISRLHLELGEDGLVAAHPTTGQTSRREIYAAGDVTSQRQSAIGAAAAGAHVAAEINHSLAVEWPHARRNCSELKPQASKGAAGQGSIYE